MISDVRDAIARAVNEGGLAPSTEAIIDALIELADLVDPRLGDARAQLWARVYATEYAVLRAYSHEQHQPPGARLSARREADAAVADFDEHYLGGKR